MRTRFAAGETATQVVAALKAAQGRPVSGARLATLCGVSRVAIHKAIRRLRRDGYAIRAVRRRGYLLRRVTSLLLPMELNPLPRTLATRIVHRPVVSSTMDIARAIAESDDPMVPTLVIAERQTAGRGRLGRRWLSPVGGIYATFLFVPAMHPARVPLAGIAFAVALAATLRRQCGVDARVKWPNDIIVSDAKVAGLLTEARIEPDRVRWLAVGVGINANQTRLRVAGTDVRATTLAALTGTPVDRAALLRAFADAAAARLQDLYADRLDAVLDAWRGMSATMGRRVRIEIPGGGPLVGRAEDITAAGALRVRDEQGTVHEVHVGDCVHLREC